MPRRVEWIERIDDGRRHELEQAVDSAARESAVRLYTRFGLAAVVPMRTFAHWVSRRRRGNRERAAETPSAAESPPTWDEIDTLARHLAVGRLRAGDPKVYELAMLMRSARDADRLDLERRAEARAAELHATRMETLRREQGAALEQVATAARLSDEQVREIRSRVLGL